MIEAPVLARAVSAGALMLAALSGTASAQEIAAASQAGPAGGTEVSVSSDSDGTGVVKLAGRALWHYDGREKYAGLVLEHVWFDPAVGPREEHDRIYLDAANHLGSDWRWRARIGSDGDTVLGSAELRRADWSKSLFVEREIIETDQGLRQGIYYTFVGASSDFRIDEANTLALTAGLQEFTGSNERIHARAKYVHAISAVPGLSAQFDARFYHSTTPGEFDYFSPRNFTRVVPLAQFRRFTERGWMGLAAVGVGGQKSTGGKWTAARFGQLRVDSPRTSRNFDAFAEVLFTNDSISGGTDYDYVMGRAGLTMRF